MKASLLDRFDDLGLSEPILRSLAGEGLVTPTPIQVDAIPHVLAGRDVIGIARTGTGKTAAFCLPIIHRLEASATRLEPRSCRVLILSPTRELAQQIADCAKTYGRHARIEAQVAVGGVPIARQSRALRPGTDILVATPGRLLDLLAQKDLRLDRVETLVLDEADRMLDMGFIEPIRRIMRALPKTRQSLLFSATMPAAIDELARTFLADPVTVKVAPPSSTAERVEERLVVLDRAAKRSHLAQLLGDGEVTRAIVFTRTKHGADKVARNLESDGIAAEAIHGNKSQSQRERALAAFRSGRSRVLVATDIAARGIDVEGVSHVVNFELPDDPDSYVHRIGRTARAGRAGMAISLCSPEEKDKLKDIERLLRRAIPRDGSPVQSIAANDTDAASATPRQHVRHQASPQRSRPTGRGGKPEQGRGPASGGDRPRRSNPPRSRHMASGERRDDGDLGGVGFLRRR